MKYIPKLPSFSLRSPGKSFIKYGLLGILFYITFLVINLPAEWLAWGVNKYSHGSFTLTQAGGTFWKGRGQLSISQNRTSPVNIGRIEWNIRSFWLLIGQIDITLDLSGDGLHSRSKVIFSPGQTKLNELRVSIEAIKLGSFYSPAALISPLGLININAKEVSINDKGMQGQIEVKWSDAGSALSVVKPLGSYSLIVTGNGKNAKIALSSSGNSSLNLAGNGSWALANGTINFNGTATPAKNKPELESLLSLMGRDLGGGKRTLRFNTRIPLTYK